MEKWTVYRKDRVFTQAKLVVWLNENYKKKTGGQFTLADVSKYVERGNLPSYLGDKRLSVDSSTGAKLIKLEE